MKTGNNARSPRTARFYDGPGRGPAYDAVLSDAPESRDQKQASDLHATLGEATIRSGGDCFLIRPGEVPQGARQQLAGAEARELARLPRKPVRYISTAWAAPTRYNLAHREEVNSMARRPE